MAGPVSFTLSREAYLRWLKLRGAQSTGVIVSLGINSVLGRRGS